MIREPSANQPKKWRNDYSVITDPTLRNKTSPMQISCQSNRKWNIFRLCCVGEPALNSWRTDQSISLTLRILSLFTHPKSTFWRSVFEEKLKELPTKKIWWIVWCTIVLTQHQLNIKTQTRTQKLSRQLKASMMQMPKTLTNVTTISLWRRITSPVLKMIIRWSSSPVSNPVIWDVQFKSTSLSTI